MNKAYKNTIYNNTEVALIKLTIVSLSFVLGIVNALNYNQVVFYRTLIVFSLAMLFDFCVIASDDNYCNRIWIESVSGLLLGLGLSAFSIYRLTTLQLQPICDLCEWITCVITSLLMIIIMVEATFTFMNTWKKKFSQTVNALHAGANV